MLCLIIPTLNAQEPVSRLLAALCQNKGQKKGQKKGQIKYKRIVTDGGSHDGTIAGAVQGGAQLALGHKGRGHQLARGAELALSDDRVKWLLFLHADSVLVEGWQEAVSFHMQKFPDKAGYFRLGFAAKGLKPRLLELWVRLRCALFALPYGDQALLIHKDLYRQVGGFSPQKLFEDVAIIRALGRKKLRALPARLQTSATKYEQQGYMRRGLKNLSLLRRYLRGENPDDLADEY